MFQLSEAGGGSELPALDAVENRALWKYVLVTSPHQLSCLPSLLPPGDFSDFSPWSWPPAVGIPNPAYLTKRDPHAVQLPFLASHRSACAITSSRAVGIATSPAFAGTGSTGKCTMNSVVWAPKPLQMSPIISKSGQHREQPEYKASKEQMCLNISRKSAV